ncbi:helix-turn-helix domain-containing protein [Pararhizobium haloflavum]|uniref:helix-turn-helix domain-containing protein n=1 Tax=Pararhizobium haloflavum TaxID=2037914 RepID=UPI000C197FC5|nr:helix-turn-helix domain-containing protein [Pararhizobium haloflavum]
MEQAGNIIQDTPDSDTLGGRIWRARDALDITVAQLARRLGVKTETIAAWEGDRSEPRANRLIMLAGVLGVSPTWLLSGVGDAPNAHSVESALKVVNMRLRKLKEQHARTADLIDSLEKEITILGRQFSE